MIYLVHIADKNIGIDIKNSIDIFMTLQDDTNDSIPSMALFHEKVAESVKVVVTLQYFLISSIFIFLFN